jgi:hypothetical protein
MSIEKDDGTWFADHSGLKLGDLKAWRDKMYEICPNPKVDDIVVVSYEKYGKKVGYKATTAEGYNTRWLRVSSEEMNTYLNKLQHSINDSSSVFFGHIDFLFDYEILNGMRRLSDEGFDDEILADYAHQMSKR